MSSVKWRPFCLGLNVFSGDRNRCANELLTAFHKPAILSSSAQHAWKVKYINVTRIMHILEYIPGNSRKYQHYTQIILFYESHFGAFINRPLWLWKGPMVFISNKYYSQLPSAICNSLHESNKHSYLKFSIGTHAFSPGKSTIICSSRFHHHDILCYNLITE